MQLWLEPATGLIRLFKIVAKKRTAGSLPFVGGVPNSFVLRPPFVFAMDTANSNVAEDEDDEDKQRRPRLDHAQDDAVC